MKREILLSIACTLTLAVQGAAPQKEIIYRPQPAEWELLVDGAKFKDRFLPLPASKKTPSKKYWGAGGVRERYIDNGIEDGEISYWGGNIVQDETSGIYHMFVCGWREDNEKGHFGYPQSKVYHATCDNPIGPFKVKEVLGLGHNPEITRAKDGSWMVYHVTNQDDRMDISKNLRYYHSASLDGPWETKILKLDIRDRETRFGGGTWFHNMTFLKREDGSTMMLNRMGSIWISEDGESPYNLVTERCVYPTVDGRYEDPVIWRDKVQYNLIVHDWIGRTAFYLRSKDGIHWEQEDGTAYTPGVIFHEDGYVEEWVKYERIRLRQDEHGRVVQCNMAVIDTLKNLDMPNDRYSSKNVSIPMNKGVLVEYISKEPLTRKSKSFELKIKGEGDFDPAAEVDIQSLRFGSAKEVNYGRGAKATKSRMEEGDMIVTFEAANNCIDHEEFAAKLIGKRKDGTMLFGYTRLPWIDYTLDIVSARKPTYKNGVVSIVVENFGTERSKPTVLTICAYNSEGSEEEIGCVSVPAIEPYKATTLNFKLDKEIKGNGSKAVIVKILNRGYSPSSFPTTL